MKKLSRVILATLLLVAMLPAQFVAPGRKNFKLTVNSGVPVQVSSTPLTVDRYVIQMAKGGTGVGYICIVPVGTTPASKCSTAGQLAGQLAAATSTAPGGSWTDFVAVPGGSIDLRTVWVDGDTSSDVMTVSANVK